MVTKSVIKSQSHILLAESNRFLSKVISNKLLRLGFNVSLANNGIEALNKIKTGEFNLILLDLSLNQKNGLEVLEEIRKNKKNKIPIVALLDFGKTSEIEKIKKLGVIDYIVKSDLSINMIADKVVKLLE